MKKIRVLRVLEYEGTEEAVMKSLNLRTVKEAMITPNITIRESIVGGISGFVQYIEPDASD